MNDAISRSAALEYLCSGCSLKDHGETPACGTPCSDYTGIKDLPAIDAVPVVHARWDDQHRCTECICLCTTLKAPQGHLIFVETPYCSNCGAKMDGETYGTGKEG